MTQATTRAGFVALIGEPNAGKSTLTNAMVGAKVSIVTHKVQTTRARIRGVAIEGDSQIVFVDTPGLFRPRRHLDRAMVAAAWTGAADADMIVLLVEAHRGLTDGVQAILDALKERNVAPDRIALAINKIDRVPRDKLLGLTAKLTEAFEFAQVFMISAEKGYGVDDLRQWLAERLPAGPWLYPEDQIADLPMRMIAAEITREKLTLRLHQEYWVKVSDITEEGLVSVPLTALAVMAYDHKGYRVRVENEYIPDWVVTADRFTALTEVKPAPSGTAVFKNTPVQVKQAVLRDDYDELEAYREIDHSEWLPDLIHAFETSDDWNVRDALAYMLQDRRGDPAVKGLYEQALESPTLMIRAIALIVLHGDIDLWDTVMVDNEFNEEAVARLKGEYLSRVG